MVVVFSMPVTRFNSFGLTMLKVVRAQGQGLVSDSGRSGHQHEGVPVGGVLDRLSFEVGGRAGWFMDGGAWHGQSYCGH